MPHFGVMLILEELELCGIITVQTLLYSTELRSSDIRNAFPIQAAAGFTATDLFIATWDRVGYYERHTDLVSKYCVL